MCLLENAELCMKHALCFHWRVLLQHSEMLGRLCWLKQEHGRGRGWVAQWRKYRALWEFTEGAAHKLQERPVRKW